MEKFPNKELRDWRQLAPGAFALLNRKEKWRACGVTLSLLFAHFLDSIALLGVMPLIGIIVEPSLLEANEKIVWLHGKLGSPKLEQFIHMLAFAAVLLIFAGKIAQTITQHLVRCFVVSCQSRLAEELISKVLSAPYEWHINKNAAVSAHHISTDVLMWANDALLRILNSVGHIFLILSSMAILVFCAPLPGIIGIVIVGIIAFILLKTINQPLLSLTEERRVTGAKYTSFANQIFAGIKDIKLSGREKYFRKEYARSFREYGRSGTFLRLIQGLPPVLFIVIGQSALVVIVLLLWHGGGSSGEISAQMALLVLVISKVVPSANRFISEASGMQAAIPSVQAIIDLKSVRPREKFFENEDSIEESPFEDWDAIYFKSVSFKYKDAKDNSLSEINLTIKKGGFYGLAGESGAGKSTFIDIFSGLIQPTSGELHVKNKLSIKSRYWRKRIGYVPQEPYIIDASLRENIAFGIEENKIDDSRVLEVIKTVNLNDYLEFRKGDLGVQLGDKGKRLSGGEKQRIAIARALYNNPEILILDEASSALDNENERIIQKSLETLKGKLTVLTIAHRLTTLINCDSIFLLDSGRLVDRGTYKELLQSSELFKKLAHGNSYS